MVKGRRREGGNESYYVMVFIHIKYIQKYRIYYIIWFWFTQVEHKFRPHPLFSSPDPYAPPPPFPPASPVSFDPLASYSCSPPPTPPTPPALIYHSTPSTPVFLLLQLFLLLLLLLLLPPPCPVVVDSLHVGKSIIEPIQHDIGMSWREGQARSDPKKSKLKNTKMREA